MHQLSDKPMPSTPAPRFWYELPNAPAPGTALTAYQALSDGQVMMLSLPQDGAMSPQAGDKPFRLLLLRSGQEIKAYVNRCAHFGVPLAAKQEQLIFRPHATISCNVHYARYRWNDGFCEYGDCEGESLMAIPVTVDGQGQICVASTSKDLPAP